MAGLINSPLDQENPLSIVSTYKPEKVEIGDSDLASSITIINCVLTVLEDLGFGATL